MRCELWLTRSETVDRLRLRTITAAYFSLHLHVSSSFRSWIVTGIEAVTLAWKLQRAVLAPLIFPLISSLYITPDEDYSSLHCGRHWASEFEMMHHRTRCSLFRPSFTAFLPCTSPFPNSPGRKLNASPQLSHTSPGFSASCFFPMSFSEPLLFSLSAILERLVSVHCIIASFQA